MNKKERKKRKEQTSAVVNIRMNAKELILLKQMMEKDGWENTAGFIKDRIFGDSIDEDYSRVASSKNANIPIMIVTLYDDINKNLSYLGYRFDAELQEFKKTMEEYEEPYRKWTSIMEEFAELIKEKTKLFFTTSDLLLANLKINPSRIQYKPEDVYPDYILEEALKEDFEGPQEIVQIARKKRYDELKAKNESLGLNMRKKK